MHLETRLSILAHVHRQPVREGFHRWYDLRWKVVQTDHPGPSPARRVLSTSGPSCDPLTVSGHCHSPVVPPPTSGHTRVVLTGGYTRAYSCPLPMRSRRSQYSTSSRRAVAETRIALPYLAACALLQLGRGSGRLDRERGEQGYQQPDERR